MKPILSLVALAAALALPVHAHARPAMAVDVETGAVIHHEEAFRPWAPASLTKLMTALVAFRAMEEGRATPDTRIVMSATAAAEPASKSYWKVGTSVSLRDALEMLIVKSANDVATAIAETLGGSEAGFAAMMNAEAARIIYGPDYDRPDNLARLKDRGLHRKRNLALNEFALGHEALTRFVSGEPLRRWHECVLAVLALESEPVDPRL